MINERHLHGFLQGLRRTVRAIALYPGEHPHIRESLTATSTAIDTATRENAEFLMSVRDEGLYSDGHLVPHASLEFNGFIQELQGRDISSLTFIRPVAETDILDLASFLARRSDDIPAGGTILLNEDHSHAASQGLSPLRRAYVGSLQSLRRATDWLAHEGAFDLNPVMGAVEDLVERSLAETKAALLLSTVKSHDEYTFYHSVNTCILTLALGKLLNLSNDELVAVGTGALLHDIGKVAMSRQVLKHPGRLDDAGWREIQRHPQEGAQAIINAGGPGHEISAAVALEHHARFDGTGYPAVNGRHRPLTVSSMVAVVDVYDALTARRRYRRAETPNRALRRLLDGAGTAHDPDLVTAFIRLMGVYPPGSILRLIDGSTAVVTSPADDQAKLEGVIVIDAAGNRTEPEPRLFTVDDVVYQLLPDRAGIDPSSLLEEAAVSEQLATG